MAERKHRLQECRKAAGYKSARAFAEHIGMPVRTYTNYEQEGRELSLDVSIQLADALGCTVGQIAGIEKIDVKHLAETDVEKPNHLQRMRKAAGWKSARAFAEHMGFKVDTYTNWEQGRRTMTLQAAWEIADELGCTIDELVGRE